MTYEEQTWNDIKEIWGNSAKGATINFQITELIDELKSKMSQFEKDAIKSDMNQIKSSWEKEKKKVSQFEKDLVRKDYNLIAKFIKKLLAMFKPKNK